jgi:hypothetical protein
MFKLGLSRDIDEFAKTLVSDFSSRFPPEATSRGAQPLARAVDEVCNRARDFRREKKLGIYGKARMGTSFKYELKGAGYAEEFVEAFTRQLLLIMSGK